MYMTREREREFVPFYKLVRNGFDFPLSLSHTKTQTHQRSLSLSLSVSSSFVFVCTFCLFLCKICRPFRSFWVFFDGGCSIYLTLSSITLICWYTKRVLERERERERNMDEKKQMGSPSSSSFTSDLFGSKESSASSSSGIFGSIFEPSSKVLGRESVHSKAVEKKQDSANQVWSTKPGAQDTIPRSGEGENQNIPNRDMSPFYQEQRVQPCDLSSSIYYGGQDIYSQPQTTQGSGYSTVNQDGVEDDSGSASRGNWWQGSLYY